jgi:hypothetical protein
VAVTTGAPRPEPFHSTRRGTARSSKFCYKVTPTSLGFKCPGPWCCASAVVSVVRKKIVPLRPFDPEDEGTTVLRNVSNHSPSDTASRPRRGCENLIPDTTGPSEESTAKIPMKLLKR